MNCEVKENTNAAVPEENQTQKNEAANGAKTLTVASVAFSSALFALGLF